MRTEFWQSPWVNGHQLFTYPLGHVIAATTAEADAIARDAGLNDSRAKLDLTFDSAQAQMRLGIFGNPKAAEAVMRGDVP